MSEARWSGPPLDHATARIVTELASALLPRLQETVAEEIAKLAPRAHYGTRAAGSEVFFPVVQTPTEETEAHENNEKISEETLRLVLKQENLTSTLELLVQNLERFSRQMEETKEETREETGEREKETETVGGTTEVLRLIEEALSRWEGTLKADGRAQTRELSEFSMEVAELLKDTRTHLLQTVRQAVEERLATRDSRLRQELMENEKNTERRLARLEKMVVASGVLSMVLFATLFLLLIG